MSEPSLSSEPVELVVAPEEAGWRLDAYLAYHFSDYSRVHMRRVICAGGVEINGHGAKPAFRLKAGERVRIVLPEVPRESPKPEEIPLEVLYEDPYLAVVNKPPGMVTHPARGHWSGTLAGAVQFRFGQVSTIGGPTRPGIVHRLDRDTSGAILVARSDGIHSKLAVMFENRQVEKEYFALVVGCPQNDRDLIDRPIGLHPHQREKMAIIIDDEERSRPAQTFYEVVERFVGFAAVRARPKTGRTHQIRVHLDHIGCSVLCDKQYGGRSRLTRGEIRHTDDETVLLDRQALHARRLRLVHPATGKLLEVEAPLPADMEAVLAELRAYRPAGSGKRGKA